MAEVRDEIRRFVEEDLFYGERLDLGTAQLVGGLLDSLGLLQLVEFIEERYGIEIADAELVPDHFQTIDAVVRLVESHLARSG